MSRVRNYLKPNFSNYWGNWVLAPLIAFFVGFLPVSSFADVGYKDGYYVDTSNHPAYTPTSNASSSPSQLCATVTSGYVLLDIILYSSSGRCKWTYTSGPFQGNIYYTDFYYIGCSDSSAEHCQAPISCPDPGTAGGITVTKYDTAVLPEFYSVDSCKFTVTEYSCSQPDLNNIQTCQAFGEFSGDPIQSGDEVQYSDPEATAGDPPKPCYTTDGRYIGTVSANAQCPSNPETRCYNPDGTLAYIVESASSCPANTSPQNKPDTTETDSDIDPETGEPTGEKTTEKTESTSTSTETVTNPDGSVTTTTTTTTTRSDGSTSTTTNSKTEHPDGTTTETTETAETEVEEASTVSGGETCSVEPTCDGDPLQCYQIKQQWRDSCGKNQHLQNLACDSGNFICEGSPIDCFIVKSRREAACEAQDAEGAVKAIQDGIASGAIEFDGTDEWGQLNALDQGEFNVSEQFDIATIWNDNGNQGTCPAPLVGSLAAGGSFEFSFQPMCDLAGYIRALVILSAMWISGSMVSQVLAGTRYTH